MTDNERSEILHSPEFREYSAALCHLASDYVPRIRVQFAQRALELYQDISVRTLVLAYGQERQKREDRLYQNFLTYADHPDWGIGLDHSCLDKTDSYGDAIKLLFDIS